jgi:tripartite-type tricarboxylate transporter receptor subunit TctC
MKIRQGTLIAGLAVAAFAAAAAPAARAAWPERPIRMMVAVPPGGPADIMARLVAPKLGEALGQPIVVENRAGANGNIAYEQTAHATPDGYTFTTVAAGVAINPSLYPSVKFDPTKDFAPISLGILVPNILVIHPSVPARNLKEFIDHVRTRAAKLPFASAGNGTTGHLALELFRQQTKLDVIHVPFKGGAPALTDVMAGHSQALFSIALVATPQVKAGRVRALGITSERRSGVAPEIPTLIESGLPGFDVQGWFGWLAPTKTPPAIVARLNAEIVKIMQSPEVREKLVAQGSDPAAGTPEEFGRFLRSEHERWAKVIKAANIKME